jgi:DMATS type aromatic prenyltransferase
MMFFTNTNSYLANCKHDAMLIFVGIDCLDPTTNKGARVKVYLHTSSNSFAVARDVMTLGGRLTDETCLKRVEVLRSIWPLLRNEQPGQGPDSDATTAEAQEAYDAWEKPERITGTPFSGLQFNVELSPGKAGLETKCYVPLFQHNANADEADASMEKVLKKLGHDWGNGKYRDTVKTVL